MSVIYKRVDTDHWSEVTAYSNTNQLHYCTTTTRNYSRVVDIIFLHVVNCTDSNDILFQYESSLASVFIHVPKNTHSA